LQPSDIQAGAGISVVSIPGPPAGVLISVTAGMGTPAGITGSVQFNSAGAFGAGALFWNNAQGRLGIGTQTPAYSLDIVGDINITGQLRINGVAITL
jgi:hypothetical protein